MHRLFSLAWLGRIPMWVRVVAGVTVSGVLAWLAFRGQDWAEVFQIFQSFPVGSAFIGLFFFALSLVLRAARWRVLFVHERISTFKLFLTQNAGTGINNILPLRVLSEPIQLALVTKRYGITGPTALATLATEHVLDIFATAVLMGVGVMFLPELRNLSIQLAGVLILGAVSLGVLLLVARGGIPGLPFVGRIPAVSRWTAAIGTLQRARWRLLLSFMFTVAHWVALGLSGWFLARGLGIAVNPMALVVMFLGATLFINSVPSAPGAAGTFEFAIIYTLELFGFAREVATPFALVMHVIIFVPPIIIALFVVSSTGAGFYRRRRAPAVAGIQGAEDPPLR